MSLVITALLAHLITTYNIRKADIRTTIHHHHHQNESVDDGMFEVEDVVDN